MDIHLSICLSRAERDGMLFQQKKMINKQGLVSFNLDRKGKKKQARSRNMDHYAMQDYVS